MENWNFFTLKLQAYFRRLLTNERAYLNVFKYSTGDDPDTFTDSVLYALQKATDRSWKTVYVVLRSNAMFMYRDKKTAHEHPARNAPQSKMFP